MKGQVSIIEEALIFSIAFIISMTLFYFINSLSDKFLISSARVVVENNGERILNSATKVLVAGNYSHIIIEIDPNIESRGYRFYTDSKFRIRHKSVEYTLPDFFLLNYSANLKGYSSGIDFYIVNNNSIYAKRFNPADFGLS